MASLVYGFVVMAWLVVDLADHSQHVPFATYEACEAAKDRLGVPYRGTSLSIAPRFIHCFKTGANQPLAPRSSPTHS